MTALMRLLVFVNLVALAIHTVMPLPDLSARTMAAHGLMGCEDAPYVARRFLQQDSRADRAISHLRRVIVDNIAGNVGGNSSVGPPPHADCAKARFELATVLLQAEGDIRGAHEQFSKVFVTTRNVSADGPGIEWYSMPLEVQEMIPTYKSSRAKMQHDAQQLAFLLQEGKVGQGAVCVFMLVSVVG